LEKKPRSVAVEAITVIWLTFNIKVLSEAAIWRKDRRDSPKKAFRRQVQLL
jgi:hypothetical protein